MNIQDIRRARLREWIETNHNGNISAFCRSINRSQPQIADMLGGRKAFGEKVARAIESAEHMQELWLDSPIKGVAEQPKTTYHSNDDNKAVALSNRIIELSLSKSLKPAALKLISDMVEQLASNTTIDTAPPNAKGLTPNLDALHAKARENEPPTAGQN